MTLPAQIARVVLRQADARGLRATRGAFRVTPAAECAVLRFRGTDPAGGHLVLLRYLVAGDAGQVGVMRQGLLPLDLAVAGAALLRDRGRYRRVRVMAGDARRQRIVPHP